jgi:hypothetical protein
MLKGLQELAPRLQAAGIPFFLLQVGAQQHLQQQWKRLSNATAAAAAAAAAGWYYWQWSV